MNIVRRLAAPLAALPLAASLAVAGFLGWEHAQGERFDQALRPLTERPPPTTVEVYDRDGERFDTFGIERRFWVDLDQMAPVLQEAVVAAEDRRFRQHGGVDPLGILRAAWRNHQAGHIVEGGSTLTQQLVKWTLLDAERTLARKAEEALLARHLERRMDKDAILERYLNTVYFGSGNYGVEAASRDYFGKHASELDTAEAALLVSLIPAPARYSPHRDPDAARRERSRVLHDLVEVGQLDEEAFARWDDAPLLPSRDHEGSRRDTVGDAYRTAVRRQVRELFGETAPSAVGMALHTPYDPNLQSQVERSLRNAIQAVYDRRGRIDVQPPLDRAGREAFLAAAAGLERSLDDQPMVPNVGDCFPAMHRGPGRELAVGPYRVPLAREAWGEQVRNAEQWQNVYGLPYGTVLDVCLAEDGAHVQTSDWLTGAAVVIDNATGGVRAIASGEGMDLEGFNQATQAIRQPGSSFKPYVYGAALRNGHDQLDIALDAPFRLGRWSPKNAGGYSGRVTLRTAITWSKNTVAARLISETGADAVRDFARDAGIRRPIRDDLTIALGSSEVTLLEHAAAYGTLVRGGRAIPPVFIEQVDDLEGRALGFVGGNVELTGRTVRLPGRARQTVEPEVAAQLVDMLGSVVAHGTGRRAFREDRARAGKTGTTSDCVEGWFMGFTPEHTIGVWIGSRDHRPMGRGEYGGRTALPAWVSIADSLDDGGEFPLPPEVYLEPWNGELVVLPREPEDTQLTQALPPFPGG